MNEILLLLKGKLSEDFLKKLLKIDKHKLYLVSDESFCQNYKAYKNILSFSFDPSSASKLRLLCEKKDFMLAFICLNDELETREAYLNLRAIHAELRIIIIDFWGLELKDELCQLVCLGENISNLLLGFIPNTPRYPYSIGLGLGEIMEVKISAASSFAFRHISSISQKRFKIVLIYRQNELILAKPGLIIKPNDSLLMVGDPKVLLQAFYKAKATKNRFLEPFGENIYTIIDMNDENMEKQLNSALFLHESLNNKGLLIEVINAKLDRKYQRLMELDKSNININFNFLSPKINFVEKNIKDQNIGLIIVQASTFKRHKNKLYELHIPILKIGKRDFKELKNTVILSSLDNEAEELANICYDLGKQLALSTNFYFYNFDKTKAEKFEYFEHLKSLAKLHEQSVQIYDLTELNPLVSLAKKEDLLQFLPFDKRILGFNIKNILSTDFNKLYYKMKNNYQLFIPS